MRKRTLDSLNSDLILCACGCGEHIHSIRTDGKPAKFKKGHNHVPRPTNGRSIDGAGYVTLWMPNHHRAQSNGRVYEHIVNWEEDNNACLLRSGIVHHKDHNRQNNSPENLEAMMRSAHVAIHEPHKHRRIFVT